MTPVITYLTTESIASRREELLGLARMSLGELRAKDASYMLDPEEQAILRELENLEYLAKVD